MKIAVLSDIHLGFGHGSELEDDPFSNFEEALEGSMGCDVILLGGDLFDTRSPRTHVWAKAIKSLSKAMLMRSGVSVVSATKQLHEIHRKSLESLPVVSIYGNHDRRMRNEMNAVEALDHAGMLVLLNKENIVLEKNGERVAIHGMSSVPERFARQELKTWNPRPVPGCFNILVIHQNVSPYAYSPLEPSELSAADLPDGFDMILDGHIHMKTYDNVKGTPFVILGSTVITQFDKKESTNEKGYHIIDTTSEPKMSFVKIGGSRNFFYFDARANNGSTLRDQMESKMSEVFSNANFSKPPVVKFRITGKDTDVTNEDLRFIEKKYEGRAVMMFNKLLESQEMTEKMEFLKNLREQKMSVEEIGIRLLDKNLKELRFDFSFSPEDVFRILSDGDVDKMYAILSGDQKTLLQVERNLQ